MSRQDQVRGHHQEGTVRGPQGGEDDSGGGGGQISFYRGLKITFCLNSGTLKSELAKSATLV